MIFTPENAELVLACKKTQTRRVVKPGETECRYRQGKSYAVQPGRGKLSIGRVTITEEPRDELLGQIGSADARREGFRTTGAFRDYWRQIHGTYDENTRVWVITFVKGELHDRPHLLKASAPQAPVCKAPLRGPDGKIVYTLSGKPKPVLCNRAFADEQDICVCGAPRPEDTDDDHGYTTRPADAMSAELEAVPPEYQRRLTKDAHDRRDLTKRRDWSQHLERLNEVIDGMRQDANLGGPLETRVRSLERERDRLLRLLAA